MTVEDISRGNTGDGSKTVALRVERARKRQLKRQGIQNSHLDLKTTERFCRTEPAAQRLLEAAMERFGLSARAYHRVLRVARTIADLDGGGARIGSSHIAEAVQYRVLDRGR